MEPGPVPDASRRGAVVRIEFELASAGGGASRVAVSVPPEQFDALIYAMLRVDERRFEDALAWARYGLRLWRAPAAAGPAGGRAPATAADPGGSGDDGAGGPG